MFYFRAHRSKAPSSGGWAAAVTRGNTIYISPYVGLNGIDALIGYISHEEAHVYINSNEPELNNLADYSTYKNIAQEYLAYSYEAAYYTEFGDSEKDNEKVDKIMQMPKGNYCRLFYLASLSLILIG